MIVTDNEIRKAEAFDEKLQGYRVSVEKNGDTLTEKQRDNLSLATAEFALDSRYIILEIHKQVDAMRKAVIGAAATIILGGMTWFLFTVLPEVLKHLGGV